MRTTLSQIRQWVPDGRITANAMVAGVSIDSRHVMPGNLFIALKGERFDAHQFLEDVAAKKAAAVVAERVPETYSLPALIVSDTRQAIGHIAGQWRRQFDIPVIGVTGSNGKTTVKEMIASILRAAFGENAYLATAGNFNNDIGVPLTLFRLESSHRAVVIELGINHIGEMAHLVKIASPTIGLVNNAQREHQEFMKSVDTVARENGTVIASLPPDGVAVFPAGETYSALWTEMAGNRTVITFGFDRHADVSARVVAGDAKTQVMLYLAGKKTEVRLATSGRHNVMNAMAAAACCLAAGIDQSAIVAGLEAFVPVKGRLESKRAFNGALLIDDTYNANPDSVRAAIDVLADISTHSVFVLGDMGEVGNEGERFHAEIGEYAKVRGIGHFFTFGNMSRAASRAYGDMARHFEDIAEMNRCLRKMTGPEMTILVKGSRFMKMERVVEQLMKKEGC